MCVCKPLHLYGILSIYQAFEQWCTAISCSPLLEWRRDFYAFRSMDDKRLYNKLLNCIVVFLSHSDTWIFHIRIQICMICIRAYCLKFVISPWAKFIYSFHLSYPFFLISGIRVALRLFFPSFLPFGLAHTIRTHHSFDVIRKESFDV